MTFESRSLDDEHRVEAFDCEVESLNSWLHNEARRAQTAGTARTYVWLDERWTDVLAYYSVAPTAVIRDQLSRSQAAGYSADVPAYLLARLALDRSLRGQNLGRQLLVDAIGKCVGAAEAYGGRLIVVDAIDERAVSFYQRYGFAPVKDRPSRLVLKIATARYLLTGRP